MGGRFRCSRYSRVRSGLVMVWTEGRAGLLREVDVRLLEEP